MTKVMISCGEASGDLYAGALVSEIVRHDREATIFGCGGDRLLASGARLVGDYRGLTVTGLTEALSVLPRSLAMYRRLVAAARTERPDVFVAVDFPDFNFRLAAAVHRLSIPVVYYVSPQIWAWRRGRVRTLKRWVDRMLVIFPFEEALYRDAGIPVEFVGHPLLDLAQARETRGEFLTRHRLDPTAPTVALLPGSRPNELRIILPIVSHAADLIAAQLPRAQFLVARAPGLSTALFEPVTAASRGRGPRPVIVDACADDVLAAADVVVTASGTATIQAAIHERPMVIVYRVTPLSYFVGKRFVHVETFGMVNLVAGERIVPELMQDACTPERVAAEALTLLTDLPRAQRMREALRRVRAQLGEPGASRRAAESVLAVARTSA